MPFSNFPKHCLEDIKEVIAAGYPPELIYEVMDCRLRFLKSSNLDLSAQQDFLHSLNDCKLDDAKKVKLKEEVAAIMDRGLPNNGHSGERVAENIPKLHRRATSSIGSFSVPL